MKETITYEQAQRAFAEKGYVELDERSIMLPSNVISIANVELVSDDMRLTLEPDDYQRVIASFPVTPAGEINAA